MSKSALDHLKAGYAAIEQERKKAESKVIRSNVSELNEVELKNPLLMLSRGFQALDSNEKTNETEIQLGKQEDAE